MTVFDITVSCIETTIFSKNQYSYSVEIQIAICDLMEYGNAISFFKLEIIIIIIIIISVVIRLDSFCYVFQSLVDPVQLVQSR